MAFSALKARPAMAEPRNPREPNAKPVATAPRTAQLANKPYAKVPSVLQHITIPRGAIELAAGLQLPDAIDEAAPPRAVVLSTPGSSVKEQIGANYASRLAARGIAALVFASSYAATLSGR